MSLFTIPIIYYSFKKKYLKKKLIYKLVSYPNILILKVESIFLKSCLLIYNLGKLGVIIL